MTSEDILKKALDTFGGENQIDKLKEELVELSKALTKYQECGDIAKHHVIEEIVDVRLVITQVLWYIEAGDDVVEWSKAKLKRLERLVIDETE